MKKLCLIVVLLVVPMPSFGAGQRLAVEAPTVMLAPGDLILRTLIEPDSANGTIQITIDSSDFYRRSEMTLRGAAAPRSSAFVYRDLPRGKYEIRAVLLDGNGEPRASIVRELNVVART
jgi:hypothetical protein